MYNKAIPKAYKRILAAMLTVCMILSMVPMALTASAFDVLPGGMGEGEGDVGVDAILHYDFASAEGTAVTDTTGTYDGTATAEGMITDGIATFDGNNKINFPIAALRQENVTVSMMVYADNLDAGWLTLLQAGAGGDNAFVVKLLPAFDSSGSLGIAMTVFKNPEDATYRTFSPGNPLPVRKWVQLTYTQSASGEESLYVNGIKLATQVVGTRTELLTNRSFTNLDPVAQAVLGGPNDVWSDDGKLSGRISDFRVFDQVLTNAQVAALTAENLVEVAPFIVAAVIEAIDALPAVENLTLADEGAVVAAREAYDALSEELKDDVTNYADLQAAEAKIAELQSAAEVQEVIDRISAIGQVTYKSKTAIAAARAAYEALTEAQKTLVSNYTTLTAAETALQAIYDAFSFTVSSGWYGGGSKQPWINSATDEEKQATYAAMSDEVKYQYVENMYKLGLTTGSKNAGDTQGMLGFEMEDKPNDNSGNPWGHGDRQMAFVLSPFTGMAFSVKGNLSTNGKFAYQLPLGDSFVYNGKVYQVYWDGMRFHDDVVIPVKMDDTGVPVTNWGYRPGSPDGDASNDHTNNTFRYAYALYNQTHKWENKTLGVPFSNTKLESGVRYQTFEGPNGDAYIAANDAFIQTVDGNSGHPEGAYVITEKMTTAFRALGADNAARFAVTGAPTANAVAGADSTTQTFEQGTLVLNSDGSSRFVSVDSVIAAIDALPEASALVLADAAAVAAARAAYDTLPEELKDDVTNYADLQAAESKIVELKAAAVQAVIDAIDALPSVEELTLENEAAVVAARDAYDALPEELKDDVTNYADLQAAEAKIIVLKNPVVQEVKDSISAIGEVTYKSKTAIAAARTAYNALDEALKPAIDNYATLTAAEAALQAIYDAFDLTVTGWLASGTAYNRAPWLTYDNTTEEQREATRAAMVDEVKYQYVENMYKLTSQTTRTVENAQGGIGFEADGQPNDNPGNPWGQNNRRLAFISSSFVGTAFSTKGNFSANGHFDYNQSPIGNSFVFEGKVYQMYWNGIRFHDDVDVWQADTTQNNGVAITTGEYFPGSVAAQTDATNNTFRYAYALYNQTQKWENKTLGWAPAHSQVTSGVRYQAFAGPNGAAYIAANDEFIKTVDANSGKPEGAYVITEGMATAFQALGADDAARFAITGAPTANAVVEENATTQEFEKGTLILNGDGSSLFDEFTDQEFADVVIAAIDALPAVEELTLEDEAAVADVRAAYDNLTGVQQGLVSNYADLQAAEAKIVQLKDAAKAQEVIDAIDALPEVGELTLDDETAVAEVRVAYDDLTGVQQGLVNNYADLQAAEAKIAELKKAVLKAALDEAIAAADALLPDEDLYTADTWAAFTAALDAAKDVAEAEDAANEEITQATDALNDAIADLELITVITGDVNGDGEVNASDVAELRKVIVAGNPTPDQITAGDLNEDGELTKDDVTLLLEQLEIVLGDVSGDGVVAPLDIMVIRKALLEDTATDEQLAAGDLDGNGEFGALDIMLLRKMLLTL